MKVLLRYELLEKIFVQTRCITLRWNWKFATYVTPCTSIPIKMQTTDIRIKLYVYKDNINSIIMMDWSFNVLSSAKEILSFRGRYFNNQTPHKCIGYKMCGVLKFLNGPIKLSGKRTNEVNNLVHLYIGTVSSINVIVFLWKLGCTECV